MEKILGQGNDCCGNSGAMKGKIITCGSALLSAEVVGASYDDRSLFFVLHALTVCRGISLIKMYFCFFF